MSVAIHPRSAETRSCFRRLQARAVSASRSRTIETDVGDDALFASRSEYVGSVVRLIDHGREPDAGGHAHDPVQRISANQRDAGDSRQIAERPPTSRRNGLPRERLTDRGSGRV